MLNIILFKLYYFLSLQGNCPLSPDESFLRNKFLLIINIQLGTDSLHLSANCSDRMGMSSG